ncbi:retrovirus-related pol polyprotein from transposon TNT 1-94 [Tanacetum coccineum]
MLAPKGSTFNGRPTFETPMYLKKAHSEKPSLYEISYDTFDLANRFTPDKEETLTLEKKSRSKLDKDLVKPYDYTEQNSTLCFRNDQFALILGYGDLVQGNITINMVYYVEGLNQNLFSIGQFCNADLEVAFQKSTCFVRDLQRNNLFTCNHGSDLYIISLQEMTSLTPIYFMAKASPTQACKAKRSSFKIKSVPSLKGRLNLLQMDLCGPMRVASINGKKYILVIVDDYSRYTWTIFLGSKDETPEVLKDFLKMIQRNLHALVIYVRTDRGTEFLNKTLNAFFKEEGIEHQTSTPRTPEQNDVVERRNRTPVEAARTMFLAFKLPLDGENLDKMKEKGDPCILFDEIKEITKTSVANNTSGLVPQRQKASDYDNSSPVTQLQNVSPSADTIASSQQELDLLFGLLYDEFFNAESTTPTNVSAEENNDNQVVDTRV